MTDTPRRRAPFPRTRDKGQSACPLSLCPWPLGFHSFLISSGEWRATGPSGMWSYFQQRDWLDPLGPRVHFWSRHLELGTVGGEWNKDMASHPNICPPQPLRTTSRWHWEFLEPFHHRHDCFAVMTQFGSTSETACRARQTWDLAVPTS